MSSRITFLVCSVWCCGCVITGIPDARPGRVADQADVVLIGKVELIPPLRPGDQDVQGFWPFPGENTIYLMTSEEPRVFKAEPSWFDFDRHLAAEFGKPFVKVLPRRAHFIPLALLVLKSGRYGYTDKAYFLTNLALDIRSNDRFIYVGTIRYHRNEFLDLQRIEVKDEWGESREEFRRRFGNVEVTKRLARPW